MAKTNLRKQKSKSKLQIIFDEGAKFVCKSFVAFYSPSETFSSTIIASKKVGNSVKRNRAKRRLREILRLQIKPEASSLKLILIARNETGALEYPLLLRDSNNLVRKIKNSIAADSSSL